jgi:transcriptional regulator of acetoin/glycerol metabolism
MLNLKAHDVRKEKQKLHEFLRGEKEFVLDDVRNAVERIMLVHAVEKERGNISAAAKRLGTSRSGLYRLLRRHKMIK